MPSPSKSSGKKTSEKPPACIDIEAQTAIPTTSGRHTANLTYDGFYDPKKPQTPLDAESGAIMGSMPVAFKVRPDMGRVLA